MTTTRPVLVFDGDCGFCTTSARVVERWVRRRPGDFAVAPWQRLDLAAFGLTADDCSAALQWVAPDGRVSSAEDAVARCLLAGRLWARPLGAAFLLPGINALAGIGYHLVARNRYRLPGGTPACALPPSVP